MGLAFIVTVEATGAPLIPLFLSAASAARMDEEAAVRVAFRHAKKGLDALGSISGSVYDVVIPISFAAAYGLSWSSPE